jgi:ribA/ribD-fused uncharacterized protein
MARLTKDACVFFWKVNDMHGWGSQWYPSPFTASIQLKPKSERNTKAAPEQVTVTFPTAEHWMMAQKALLFGDHGIAREVLAIEGSGQDECKMVKGLGRKVRGFDEDVWVRERGEC